MVYNEQICIALYNGEWFLGNGLDWETVTDKFIVGLTVPIPTAKKYEIDIPGRHGTLDLSDAIDGVKYNNRVCGLKLVAKTATTDAEIEAFIRTYNGKRCVLDVQAEEYKLIGRFAVLNKKENKAERILSCEFNAEPLKIKSTQNYGITPTASGESIPGTYKVSAGVTGLQYDGQKVSFKHSYTSDDVYAQYASAKYEFDCTGKTKIMITAKRSGKIGNLSFGGTARSNFRWTITDAAGNVLVDTLDGEKLLYNENGFGKLMLNISSTANSAGMAKLVTHTLEISLKTVSAFIFTNSGEETIARYSTNNPTGSFEIWLNDVCVLNKQTYEGSVDDGNNYQLDPRLIVKHGTNIAFFKALASSYSLSLLSYRESEL